MSRPGAFIVIEGSNGSGKSTAASSIVARYEAQGRTVVRVREPGGTGLGEAVRQRVIHNPEYHGMQEKTRMGLMLSCRAELVSTVILPALEAGHVVVCDRYMESTLVFQAVLGGLPFDEVLAINDFFTGGLYPDVTLVFLTDHATAQARMAERAADGDVFDGLPEEGFNRVRDGYLEVARRFQDRTIVIDASGPPEDVSAAAWEALAARLPL